MYYYNKILERSLLKHRNKLAYGLAYDSSGFLRSVDSTIEHFYPVSSSLKVGMSIFSHQETMIYFNKVANTVCNSFGLIILLLDRQVTFYYLPDWKLNVDTITGHMIQAIIKQFDISSFI